MNWKETERGADRNDLSAENRELRQEVERLRNECEEARRTGVPFTHIANALSRDYTDLFYVNMDTDEYIEYHTDDERGVLVESRRASDFFESCEREGRIYVHAEDQERFVTAMKRAFLEDALDRERVFRMTYRRIKNGRVFYVEMKVSRMRDDRRIIVVAVSDIDELVMKRREEEIIQEERIIYARLHAITGNFLVVYVVDPETGDFREFSSTRDYETSFTKAEEGKHFFEQVRKNAGRVVYPPDLNRFLAVVSRETILSATERSGIFSFGFQLLQKGNPLHVQLKAAMVEEREGPRLIVGINDIDAQVRQEEEMERRLVQAEIQANIDALTGVRNKHSYLEAEAEMNERIKAHTMNPFAIVMLDMNDLKTINDTEGHNAGDRYLRGACKVICDVFKHSPVFRVGGDEFAVIAQGEDYEHLEERLEAMRAHNEEAALNHGAVIACGMAKYENDDRVSAVFERADQHMYEDKNRLKSSLGN